MFTKIMDSGLFCCKLSAILLVYLRALVRAHPFHTYDGFIESPATYTSSVISEPMSTASLGLSVGAAAAISVGAFIGAGLLPVVIVAGIGACLEWRQPRTTGILQADREMHAKDIGHSMVYPKAELSAEERVIYELDGQDAVLEIDGVAKAVIGELYTCNHSRNVEKMRRSSVEER